MAKIEQIERIYYHSLDKYEDLNALTHDMRKLAVQTYPELIYWIGYTFRDIQEEERLKELRQIAVKKSYQVIKLIFNPDESLQFAAVEKDLNAINLISYPTERVKDYVICKDFTKLKYVKNPPVNAIIEVLRTNGDYIKYISNPGILSQMEAVEKNPKSIRYIRNPCNEAKEIAKSKDPNCRLYFDKSSRKYNSKEANKIIDETARHIMLSNKLSEWVEKDPFSLRHVRNPSYELKKITIGIDPFVMVLISAPSIFSSRKERVEYKELCRIAIEKDPFSIVTIENPSEEIQLEAVRKDPFCINLIENPTIRVQKQAIRYNFYAYNYIRSPKKEIQEFLISTDPCAIKLIDNPSEELQLKFLELSDFSLHKKGNGLLYLRNPTKKVLITAVTYTLSAIRFVKDFDIDVFHAAKCEEKMKIFYPDIIRLRKRRLFE